MVRRAYWLSLLRGGVWQVTGAVSGEGFLDTPAVGGSDALVDGQCLPQVGGAFGGVAILAECLDAGWWDEPLAGVARLSCELGAAMDRALAEAGRDDAPLPRNVVPIDRGRA
jgi:hypothetical protein